MRSIIIKRIFLGEIRSRIFLGTMSGCFYMALVFALDKRLQDITLARHSKLASAFLSSVPNLGVLGYGSIRRDRRKSLNSITEMALHSISKLVEEILEVELGIGPQTGPEAGRPWEAKLFSSASQAL